MPTPASASARRHDSNNLPPAYHDHDTAIKHHDDAPSNPSTARDPRSEPTVQSSLLQPRVAVALGLSAKWHPLLFVCRLLSILPALWWGVPVAVRLLAQAILLAGSSSVACAYEHKTQSIPWLRGLAPDLQGSGADAASIDFETRLRMTEMVLGIVWCSSSAYLSFTFTDSLMSRWLLLYTPQATLVRLLAVNATNLYLTSQTLHLLASPNSSGSDAEAVVPPRLFLPAWIAIAAALTGLYHATQRRVNIRKETRLSISVFSVASFVSMVALLAAVQAAGRPELPAAVPAVQMARRGVSAWEAARARLREWEWGVREEL